MTRLRPVSLGPRGVQVSREGDGSIVLRSPFPLAPYPRTLSERLRHWAAVAGDRIFLAERDAAGGWRTLNYRDTLASVRRVAQALLDRRLSPQRPVLILSGNGIEHALLGLAAMHVGIPYASLSTSCSLLSTDFARVRHASRIMTPGLVFADHGARYAGALDAATTVGTELVVSHDPPPGQPVRLFAELLDAEATAVVDEAASRVDADTVAKILFTSGSSAAPKGVINSQRMLCGNQQMHLQAWPFLAEKPPVIVDWAPWSHTFGANAVFNAALYNGGTLHIDSGRPTPEEIGESVRNLTDIRPTVFFGVPVVFQMLLPHLERNTYFRERFFSRLDMMFYAGATLPPKLWDRLRQLAVDTCGERILMTTGMGATEVGATLTTANWDADRAGAIGLPLPGVELKLVPSGGKLELRARGPTIMPGYWRQPELTAKAFDDDGWYCLGDAVKFMDPLAPEQGLMFDGRLAENFKLITGTWVNVGPLRVLANDHFAPLVLDLIICGEDRDEIGALVFVNPECCRELAGGAAGAVAGDIVTHPAVIREFQRRLDQLFSAGTATSNRVARAILIADIPRGFELTDKKTLSHNVVLQGRKPEIVELYSAANSSRVLVAQGRATGSNIADRQYPE